MREFKIYGNRYSETPNYCDWDIRKEYPHFEKIHSREWVIEAEDLWGAEKWLVENYPLYFMGSCIVATEPEEGYTTCDFVAHAVPCEYWECGNYELESDRVHTVREYVKDNRW